MSTARSRGCRTPAGNREVEVVYPEPKGGADPAVKTMLTEMTIAQKSLYDLPQLDQYTA